MELALPITVYWDLAPGLALDESLLRFCDEIIECRPLMLQLYDSSPVLGEGTRAVLARFGTSSVAVSLTITAECLSSLPEASSGALGVKELLLACDNLPALKSISESAGLGVAFYVTRGNWRELPEVVSLCREQGVKRLVLPMQRLYHGEEPFLLSRLEQDELERALAVAGGVSDFRLTIHDPFLWRAFNPGIPFPQGGCQAANTMIAISPDGGVYPCPTFPVRLGDMGITSLKSIILSPVKKELRGRILKFPAACDGCRELSICCGGCRGRSYVKRGSYDDLDDACR